MRCIGTTPSNHARSGRPKFFNEEDLELVIAFITLNRETGRMSWEAIKDAMELDCSTDTIKNAVMSKGYNKRMPRKKFGVQTENQAKRV